MVVAVVAVAVRVLLQDTSPRGREDTGIERERARPPATGDSDGAPTGLPRRAADGAEFRRSQWTLEARPVADVSGKRTGRTATIAVTVRPPAGSPPGDLASVGLVVDGLSFALSSDSALATRSYLSDGEYKVVLELVRAGRTLARSTVQVSVRAGPGEEQLLRELASSVLVGDGVIDGDVLGALVDTEDMRTVPTLWQVVRAAPHADDVYRRVAARALARLAHVDSLPELVELIADRGLWRTVARILTAVHGGPSGAYLRRVGDPIFISAWRQWLLENEGPMRRRLHQPR